jgi:hypothetical protein
MKADSQPSKHESNLVIDPELSDSQYKINEFFIKLSHSTIHTPPSELLNIFEAIESNLIGSPKLKLC